MNGGLRWAVALMTASGFAALGYQIVWTQQSALWLGHETAAVLAVVAAFFGGISAGALFFSARIEASTRPVRWYAACEAVIGLWSLALIFLMPRVANLLLDLIGVQPAPLRHWSVVFGGAFLLLLPATAAMGATLPAMERMLGAMRAGGAPIAVLYASNTLGAVLGVLVAAFVLVPTFGLSATALACVIANLFCAVTALKVFAPTCEVRLRPVAARSSRALVCLCRHRAPRHWIRSTRRSRSEPGRRKHGVHVRDPARGVSHRHHSRRRGIQPLDGGCARADCVIA